MFGQKSPQKLLDSFLEEAKVKLGENLASLAVYGSFVRGSFKDGKSDINVLVILKGSNAKAHKVIASLTQAHPIVNPFVVGLKGMERSMKVFTLKFASIRRNFKLLYGKDPFENWEPDERLDRFVVEQQIRNLRLRLVHTYTMRHKKRSSFPDHLKRIVPSLFTDISEAARIAGKEVPGRFEERSPVFEETFGIKFEVLKTLLEKRYDHSIGDAEAEDIYSDLIDMLNGVVSWIEEKWELSMPSEGD